MDEEKAAKTLTAVLVKHFGSQVVQDQRYKDKLTKSAFCVLQFSEPLIMGYNQFYMKEPDSEGNKYRFGFVNNERTKKQFMNVHSSLQEAVDDEEKCDGANYFFVGDLVQEKDRAVHFFVTPYSILGDKEAQNLRGLFYKNVPPDIMSAMHALGITYYTELYRLYSSNSIEEGFLEGYHAYLKLEDMLAKLEFEPCDSIIRQSKIENLMGMSVEELNKTLGKKIQPIYLYDGYSKTDERYAVKKMIEHTKNEAKTYMAFGKWLDILPGFFNFIFSLPIEDKNLEANLKILRLLADELDYVGILAKEYSESKNFKEYFSCLDSEKQEKVVDSLKALQGRNSENDAFLWSQGFKDIGMDYLKLYKEDADTFIEYFKNRTIEEKKVILRDIMDYEFTNEKVIDWLNKNEAEPIREVGFNG